MSHKGTPVIIEIINFKTESLAFENRFLNGAHSISDTKLLRLDLFNALAVSCQMHVISCCNINFVKNFLRGKFGEW